MDAKVACFCGRIHLLEQQKFEVFYEVFYVLHDALHVACFFHEALRAAYSFMLKLL